MSALAVVVDALELAVFAMLAAKRRMTGWVLVGPQEGSEEYFTPTFCSFPVSRGQELLTRCGSEAISSGLKVGEALVRNWKQLPGHCLGPRLLLTQVWQRPSGTKVLFYARYIGEDHMMLFSCPVDGEFGGDDLVVGTVPRPHF